MTQPPPNPPPPHPPIDYRSPKTKNPTDPGHLGAPQPIFDTVVGPNLRLRDNLIQLACVIIAVILGMVIALFFIQDKAGALVVGALAGLIGGILISGGVIGIYRFIRTIKPK